MRQINRNPHAAAQAIASVWKLTVNTHVIETTRAHIFKVDGPDGCCALKLYKKIGYSGEGAAIHFLRDLGPTLAPRIYRASVVRAAVLMEWLDGPQLDEIADNGQDDRATEIAAEVAQGIVLKDFGLPIRYRRYADKMRRDFTLCHRLHNAPTFRASVDRIEGLLDAIAKSSRRDRVIHGDLGFGNIIVTPDGPRVIDPKGMRIDPAFEFAVILVRPCFTIELDNFVRRTTKRGQILSRVSGIDEQHILKWAAIILGHMTIYGGRKRPERAAFLPYVETLLDIAEA